MVQGQIISAMEKNRLQFFGSDVRYFKWARAPIIALFSPASVGHELPTDKPPALQSGDQHHLQL